MTHAVWGVGIWAPTFINHPIFMERKWCSAQSHWHLGIYFVNSFNFLEGICRLTEGGDRISLVSKDWKWCRKLASWVFETWVRWQNRPSETRVLELRWRNLATWNSSFLDSRSIWRTKETDPQEEEDTIWKIRSETIWSFEDLVDDL